MGRRQVKREPASHHVGVDAAALHGASPSPGHSSSSGNTEGDLERVVPEVFHTGVYTETPQITRKSLNGASSRYTDTSQRIMLFKASVATLLLLLVLPMALLLLPHRGWSYLVVGSSSWCSKSY